MKRGTTPTLFILLLAILFACNKENESIAKQPPPVILGDMVKCHNTTTWDSAAIYTKLLGQWEWEYIQCYWSPENGNYNDFKGLTVKFNNNSTVTVSQNGQTTQTSTFKLERTNDGYFKLITTPFIVQLPGKVIFCTERVLFFDSYIDGCDNYFKRLN